MFRQNFILWNKTIKVSGYLLINKSQNFLLRRNCKYVVKKILIERLYLTRETVNNNFCKIATNKQEKTIELVIVTGLSGVQFGL